MKKKTVYNILLILAALMMFVSMAMAYISIPSEKISGNEKEVLNYLCSLLGIKENASFSAISLISGLRSLDGMSEFVNNSVGSAVIIRWKIVLILPCVNAVLILILSLLKYRWSYLATAFLSLISPAVLLAYYFGYLPWKAKAILDALVDGAAAHLTIQLILGNHISVVSRKIIAVCLGVGFWGIIVSSALCFLISVIAFLTVKEPKNRFGGYGYQNYPGY